MTHPTPHYIAGLAATVAAIYAAPDLAAVQALYEHEVGYDPACEGDTRDCETLRADLIDYMREACHGSAIHVSAVGIRAEGAIPQPEVLELTAAQEAIAAADAYLNTAGLPTYTAVCAALNTTPTKE